MWTFLNAMSREASSKTQLNSWSLWSPPCPAWSPWISLVPTWPGLDRRGTANVTSSATYRVSAQGILSHSAHCSVSSLNSSIIHRMDRPLQFLGLYKTHNDASGRHLIPARVISGDTDESQILVAGQRYLDRPTVLESILNDLFHVLRYLVMSPRSDLLPSYFQI